MNSRRLLLGVLAAGILSIAAVTAYASYYSLGPFRPNLETTEGQNTVRAIALGAVQCAASHGLPVTSTPVPASLSAVRGKKYQSTRAEWNAEPWTCMNVEVQSPQYFQYRWTRASDTLGIAEAVADLDGDGKADVYVAQHVECVARGAQSTCGLRSPLVEKYGRSAPDGLP